MIRRRLLSTLGLEEDEVKEWKVLLDQTVTDNSIFYYTAEVPQGCKEFYVSVFFANDEEITSAINGRIALNANASPWSTGINISGNIDALVYASHGNNNKANVFGFEITNGIVIPTRMFSSTNTGASSKILNNGAIGFALDKSSDNTELSYKTIDEIENISIGSYTKYFGVGSKILILGR